MSEKEIDKTSQTPVYKSECVLTKEKFRDFCSVNYRRTKIIFIVGVIILIPIVVLNLVVRNFGILPYCMIYPICFGIILYRYERLWKIGYEKRKVSFGEDTDYETILNEECISVSSMGLKRDYSYEQITGLYETDNFLMLHLKLQLFASFCKDGNSAELEKIKQFILSHCNNVKKRKFIDVRNDRMVCIILISLLGAICLFATVVSLIAR